MNPQIPTLDITDIEPNTDEYILDVREDDEWAAGRIETAHHIPMNSVPANLDSVPTDRRVVVVCKMGGRSAQVTAWLRTQGVDAHNLDGGMLAWAVAHRPMVATGDAEPFIA